MLRFRFKDLEGFHPNIQEAFAANSGALAQFITSEIDYRVSELDDALMTKRYDDEDAKDYIEWLAANGGEGQFPLQRLLADSPEKRKTWAARHIDAEAIAEGIMAMPDAMLQEFHPLVEIWSEKGQVGVPADNVVAICPHCGEPHESVALCLNCCTRMPERLYPLHARLSTEEVVTVNVLLAAISPDLSVGRLGVCWYEKPPADVLTLTRLLYDRGSPLVVAYLPTRLEVFHKEIPSPQERAVWESCQLAVPTAQNPNPLGSLLPAGSPTAFDLPAGKNFDNATGIMEMLTKLTTSNTEPTMDEALAFEKAVNQFVGKAPAE